MAIKTPPASNELKKLARHRLIGASTLVLLVVVFLPMVLDKEPRPISEDIIISIPDIPLTVNAPLEQKYYTTPPTDSAGNSSVSDKRKKNNETEVDGVKAEKDKATDDGKTYVVQLGAFSDSVAVSKLVETVEKINLPVYTESLNKNGKVRTRVRIGPYSKKNVAQSVVKKVKALRLRIGEPAVLLVRR